MAIKVTNESVGDLPVLVGLLEESARTGNLWSRQKFACNGVLWPAGRVCTHWQSLAGINEDDQHVASSQPTRAVWLLVFCSLQNLRVPEADQCFLGDTAYSSKKT